MDKGKIALKLAVGELLTRPEALSYMWRTLMVDTSRGYTHSSIPRVWLDAYKRLTGRPLPKDIIKPLHKATEVNHRRVASRKLHSGPSKSTKERADLIRSRFRALVEWLDLGILSVKQDENVENRIRYDRSSSSIIVPRNFLSVFHDLESIKDRFVQVFPAEQLSKCLLLNERRGKLGGFKTGLALMPLTGQEEMVLIGKPEDIYREIMHGNIRVSLSRGWLDRLATERAYMTAIPLSIVSEVQNAD